MRTLKTLKLGQRGTKELLTAIPTPRASPPQPERRLWLLRCDQAEHQGLLHRMVTE